MSEPESNEDPPISDGCAGVGCAVFILGGLIVFCAGPCSVSTSIKEKPAVTAKKPSPAPRIRASSRPAAQPVEVPKTIAPAPPTELQRAEDDLKRFLAENPKPQLPETLRRFWVDTSGAHGIYATVVGIENDVVSLNTDSGKVVLVPVDRLSELDRNFLEKSFSNYQAVVDC